MILETLYLTITTTYIVDMSGIVSQLKRLIHRIINGNIDYIPFNLKPFDCSLCMTFWVVLIYFLFNGQSLMMSMLIASIASYSTVFITSLMKIIYSIYNKLTDKLI